MNKEEIIRFYEGDVTDSKDALLSDPKAYVTWNALLFPTIETEIARSEENRKLNPAFIDEYKKVIDLTCSLFEYMKPSEKEQVVYRVERLADYSEFLSEGMFTSFISTSTSGFLDAYEDKAGLVLLEIHLDKGNLCLDFSKELNSYLKEDEKEILLSPYTCFKSEDLKMDDTILSIKDRNGKSPVVYSKITLGNQNLDYIETDNSFGQDTLEASKRFYACLNEKKQYDLLNASKYVLFKTGLQNEIKKRMKEYVNQ